MTARGNGHMAARPRQRDATGAGPEPANTQPIGATLVTERSCHGRTKGARSAVLAQLTVGRGG
jgi:hypothetical protein